MFMPKTHKSGFTLAELLIALAILGEIATFTIPKIISAQQKGIKKTVIKETVATLNQAVYLGVQSGEISDSTFFTYLSGKINSVKLCSSNATSDGCVTGAVPHSNFGNYPGFILHNGALVTCGNAGGMVGYRECLIDWNGAASPNLNTDDQFIVHLIYNNSSQGMPGKLSNHPGWTPNYVWAPLFE